MSFSHKTIRDILLLAHRQAYAWMDEWYELSYEDIVNYERETYMKTNEKVMNHGNNNNTAVSNLNEIRSTQESQLKIKDDFLM